MRPRPQMELLSLSLLAVPAALLEHIVWLVLLCPITLTSASRINPHYRLIWIKRQFFQNANAFECSGLLLIYTVVWIYSSKLPFCPELTALAVSFQNKGLEACLREAASQVYCVNTNILETNKSVSTLWRHYIWGMASSEFALPRGTSQISPSSEMMFMIGSITSVWSSSCGSLPSWRICVQ